MVRVEGWAEIRRLHFVKGLSIRDIARRTGHGRNAIRRAIRADVPPRYGRPARASKLEPHKPEIERLLRDEPRMPAMRIRELIAQDASDELRGDPERILSHFELPSPASQIRDVGR